MLDLVIVVIRLSRGRGPLESRKISTEFVEPFSRKSTLKIWRGGYDFEFAPLGVPEPPNDHGT